jgi:hypothetical protein
MRLRYEQLFSVGFTTAYYADNLSHDDFIVEPTRYCQRQMSRYKILSKKTFDGISLVYECSPFTNDATPFRPITTIEKFTFKVTVANADFWYYADVNNWEKDKIYLLKNPVFNTTGTINVLSGPLNAPVLFRPMEFKYETPLENTPGLLKVMDATGNVLRTIIVRAKTPSEPVGKTEPYFIDLKNFTDGSYTLRHVTSGGDVDELVYCSADYSPDTLAIVEISYRTGVAWTGVQPFQRYAITVSSRLTDWFFDVHIRKKPVPFYVASQLSIKHLPVAPEPLHTFSVVGVPDDINGFVQFKSIAKVMYSQKPMHLQLLKSLTTTVLDPLPLPSSITVQKDSLNNLITKVVVNV